MSSVCTEMGSTAVGREDKKVKKYSNLLENYHFVPVGIETYGAYGPQAINIFFRNKTFLFVKIEIWNFQRLFDLLFHETLQNLSLFQTTLITHKKKCCQNVCLNELKFFKVSQNPKSNSC